MARERLPTGLTVRCANCLQLWLVPGLRPGDTHVCKACGRPLLVGGRAPRPSGGKPRCGDLARASGKV